MRGYGLAMRVPAIAFLALASFGLSACTSGRSTPAPTAAPGATAALPSPGSPVTLTAQAMSEQCQSRGRFVFERPDLAGSSLADVRRHETRQGHTIRIVGQDGSCSPATDDLRNGRVDVYVQSGKVLSANMEVSMRPMCPKRLALHPVRSSRPGIAGQTVPAGAMYADLCRYSGVEAGRRAGRLVASAHPDATGSAELAGLLNTAGRPNPVNSSQTPVVWHCPSDDGAAAAAFFTYPSGKPVVVQVALGGCAFMTNGPAHMLAGAAIIDWVLKHTPAKKSHATD